MGSGVAVAQLRRAVASDTRDPQFESNHWHCNNAILFIKRSHLTIINQSYCII